MARRWSSGEDERLRRGYVDGVPLVDLAKDLGRSADALVARRTLLRIPSRRAPRPWTSLEDQLLAAAVEAHVPASVLASRIGRSVHQIVTRRRRLGLTTPSAQRYTSGEDALLRAAWTAGTQVDELAHRLGRSPGAVRAHAEALGLHRPARRRRWTIAEEVVVRDAYADGFTCRCIADGLPGRSPDAVAARARKLGLATYGRAWTPLEDHRLRGLTPQRSPAEIARSAPHRPRRGPAPAGPQQTTHCSRLHAGLNPGVLAERLGRSDVAVVARLRQLGMRDGRHRSLHHPAATHGGLTAGEQRLVQRELADTAGRGLLALARRLDRSPASIRDHADPRAGEQRIDARRRIPSTG